jgi:hypothetical protein
VKGFFHALTAAAVVTSAGAGLSYGSRSLPKGPLRDDAERFVVAPGRILRERLENVGVMKKAEKKVEDKVETAEKTVAKAERKIGLNDHIAAVGTWALVGLVFCWIAVLWLGISSLETALALGFKVTLFMVALQASLVLTGVLAYKAYG